MEISGINVVVAPSSLEARREHERQKYLALFGRTERPRRITKNRRTLPVKVKTYAKTGLSVNQAAWRDKIFKTWALPIRNAVDFGCGRNRWCIELRAAGLVAVGVDFACPLADVEAPMHNTRLPSGKADLVTAWDSIEHCLEEDVPLVLAEMRRVAKPGALFLAHIPSGPSKVEVDDENLHATQKPADWWLATLAAAGLRDVQHNNGDYWGRFNG